MTTNDITDLFRYNDWANHRFLDVVRGLPSEIVTRDLGTGFRSIRELVGHLVAAEWVWLERWRGISPPSIPDWVTSADLSVLLDHLAKIQGERLAFLKELSDSSLASEIAFRYISGTSGRHALGDLLVHLVNHSTYHRGQLAYMLRQAGTTPPSTDFVIYKSESPK